MRDTQTKSGFTIMELLVAITITSLMLFLINQLFSGTSRAVRLGAALSDVIADGRAAGDQFVLDSKEMAGPDPNSGGGGFLVIINRRIGDWDGDEDFEPLNLQNPEGVVVPLHDGQETRRWVRSDQLLYIKRRRGPDERPIAPATQWTFSNATASGDGYIRIWYGHLLRTDGDGTDFGADQSGTPLEWSDGQSHNLQRPFPDRAELGEDVPGNPNRLGIDFILGRQALFLGEGNETINRLDGDAEHDSSLLTSAYDHTDLDGVTAARRNGFPRRLFQRDSRLLLYMGIADVTDVTLDQIRGKLKQSPDYATKAVRYTYAQERLRANPVPQYDASVENFESTYASWQIAQSHSVFMNHCSEFQVTFAGDYVDDGSRGIDKDENGDIIWYDHFDAPPLEGFQEGPDNPVLESDGPVYHKTPGDSDDGLPLLHADAAFVFRHNDVGDGTNWPYLIKIRYRLHDPRGRLASNNLANLNDGLDNDGDGLLDEDDPDEAIEPGKVFEQVIRVKRD